MNKTFEQLVSLKADKYKDALCKFADVAYKQYGVMISIRNGVLLKRHRTFKTVIYFGKDEAIAYLRTMGITWRKIFNAIFWVKIDNGKRRTQIFQDGNGILRAFVMPKSIDEALVNLDLEQLETY